MVASKKSRDNRLFLKHFDKVFNLLKNCTSKTCKNSNMEQK